MSEDEEEDKMRDLSKSVNAACTKWLLGRGIKTGQWGHVRDMELAIKRAKEERAAKESKP